ncbi:hypothetical protein ACFLTX_03625 [Chloroflexota bacterium]
MKTYQYCTREWLEESARQYAADPRFENEFAKITQTKTKYVFRVKAEQEWGIDRDVLFGAVVEKGRLLDMTFYNEHDAGRDVDFILAATPQEWTRLLRKETKFIAMVMLKKVQIEHGEFAGLLKIAPHGDAFVDALTQVPLQFPDEMSTEELQLYRQKLNSLQEGLGD